jgi:cysteine desulfurase
MGIPVDWALGAVRTSLGASTTAEDIDYVIDVLTPLVQKIRAMSPAGAA